MRTVEDHPEAAANLRRLLGEERWNQLVSPPFKLWIPSKLDEGCYWGISARGRVSYFDHQLSRFQSADGSRTVCRAPAAGFNQGVPVADKILAMLLWIIADERSFWHRRLPPVRFTGKGRLAQWDAIFEGVAGQGMK